MTQTEQTLLTLLRRGLFGSESAPIPEDTDYQALLLECAHHTVAPLVYDSMTPAERDQMPSDASKHWHMTVMHTIFRNEQIAAEQRRVLSLLAQAEIPCVIMKGTSSAMNYPKPELRVSGDIDLLFSPEQIDDAQQLLMAEGYKLGPGEDGEGSHRSLHRGMHILELHYAPCGLPDTPTCQELRRYFLGAERSPAYYGQLPILPRHSRAVLLLAHKLEHVTTSGLGLRHLCDWAMFVDRELDAALWEEISPTLKRFGLMRFARIVTRTCVDFLGLSAEKAPWCMEIDTNLASSLMTDILRSGNFGHKENRYGQRLFTDFEAKNRIFSLFSTGFKVCREQWEPCRKCPVLLPIAPFVLVFRYKMQRKRGERPPLKPFAVYQSAGDRQKLYKALKPFLPEK